eukprot:m51a1_g2314 hypothetical protein (520) ;mRNA; f:479661-481425
MLYSRMRRQRADELLRRAELSAVERARASLARHLRVHNAREDHLSGSVWPCTRLCADTALARQHALSMRGDTLPPAGTLPAMTSWQPLPRGRLALKLIEDDEETAANALLEAMAADRFALEAAAEAVRGGADARDVAAAAGVDAPSLELLLAVDASARSSARPTASGCVQAVLRGEHWCPRCRRFCCLLHDSPQPQPPPLGEPPAAAPGSADADDALRDECAAAGHGLGGDGSARWTRDCLELARAMSEVGCSSCIIARAVGRPCYEVSNLMLGDDDGALPPADEPPAERLRRLRRGPRESEEQVRPVYVPCEHEGECCGGNEQCACTRLGVCEEYCACPASCPRRRKPCSCPDGCRGESCPCRASSRECGPRCQCGAAPCCNSAIASCAQAKILAGPSATHGWGCFAGQRVAAGQLVAVYAGEMLDTTFIEDRMRDEESKRNWYLSVTAAERTTDARWIGCKARFFNSPSGDDAPCNAFARMVTANGIPYYAIYAATDIQPGEEITFDYGAQYWSELH